MASSLGVRCMLQDVVGLRDLAIGRFLVRGKRARAEEENVDMDTERIGDCLNEEGLRLSRDVGGWKFVLLLERGFRG